MPSEETYALTPLGEKELRSSATGLTPAQIAVLVRIDGRLTMAQLKAGMAPAEAAAFSTVLRELLDRRLVAPMEPDPFSSQWNADVALLTRAVGQTEADAGLASLQRSGFYVQIARERPVPRRLQPGERLCAVLVEDDAFLANFTSTLLSLSGFDVRQAGNRDEIVAQIRQPPRPDIILLDVMLPDADGFDILRRVRQHPVLRDVPVIMLTGKTTREAVLRGLADGADGYITKPFEPDALLRAVRSVLGLPDEEKKPGDRWTNRDAR